MDIKQKAKQLPPKSGVYLFKNYKGEIIYIGKAISLRNRVSSYFSKSYYHSPKVNQMIEKVYDIDYILTASEMEALLLESNLVKTNQPYFNTQLKDDKSYPYIKISRQTPFPAIQLVRRNKMTDDKKARYFGPFIDVEVTRKAVKKMREIFKLRNCTERKFKQGKTCLDYQIGLCSAPCAKKINQEDYQKSVSECCLLLSGQHTILLRKLREEMKIASQLLFFEKAAKIRDTINMIEKVITQQKISKAYRKKLNHYLQEKRNHSSLKHALLDLKKYLKLAIIPSHIEAFDISNIHGQLSVGSMVVFIDGIPDKRKYRHYKIKGVEGINDFAMMKEVVYRRFRDSKINNEKLPDLVLIDGGKGQLSSVVETIQELKIEIGLASLAKREEELFQPANRDPIILPRNSEAFFLIQRIRDEAHRFAISYHKKLRNKLIKNSVIDFIPGIGEKRKKQLLSKFKSIDHIRQAKIEELQQIPGIGKKTAITIKQILEVRNDFEIR
jgi:excinuclease ABC subunit C